ncbi:hypothetical protein L9F63_010835, partial [Diploptera punctata]
HESYESSNEICQNHDDMILLATLEVYTSQVPIIIIIISQCGFGNEEVQTFQKIFCVNKK